MAALRLLSKLLVCSSLATFVLSEQMCEDITLAACSKASYTQTARFPLVHGKPYDKTEAANALEIFVPLLQQCSGHASTILCSMYLPKCIEGVNKPIPPCRSVCQQFVHDCKSTLRGAAIGGLFTSMCELLPDKPGSSNDCFNPAGFKPGAGISPVGGCFNLTIKSCADDLHYNSTSLTKADQKDSNDTVLQPVIDSKCSPDVEKYFCFLRFPKCAQRDHGVYIPCRSLCEQVRNKCQGELKKLGFDFPYCDFGLPDNNTETGLCLIKTWPAPWPKKFRSPLPDLKCVPITVKSCAQMEYTKTANYPNIDGRPFQTVKGELLDFYIPLMAGCSPYLKLIMCSLFLPKCEDRVPRPILPCRHVCQKFVNDCQTFLRLASVGGMFTALCDLLPEYNCSTLPQGCILPKDFENSPPKVSKRNICHKLESNSCTDDLHYNSTFLSSQDQVASSVSLLQPIVDSKCSVDAEKLLCFSRVPPCSPKDTSVVHLPCKSLCDKVVKECGGEFDKNKIIRPYCNATYPDDVSPSGMCELRDWPAPWPWPIPPSPAGHQKCEPVRAPSCAKAGYKFTAKFPPKNGKCYQDTVEEDLRFFNNLLKTCSPFSSTILCSLYLPKCSEGVDRPLPPCRSVCLSFVHDCLSLLRLASVGGMFTALCDLLPGENSTPGQCFVPDGYKKPTASPVDPSTDVCHPVESGKCTRDLHYNHTFVGKADQAISDVTVLQTVIESKCSPDIEKFLCFTRLPPCTPKEKVAHLPCRSLCEKIHEKCSKVIKDNGLKLPRCDPIYPDGSDPSGLCPLRAWPAPWPRKRPPPSSSTSAPPSIGNTSKSKKSKAGMIAGVVVTLILILIGGAVLGFLYYRRHQRDKQFTAQHFVNVQDVEPIAT